VGNAEGAEVGALVGYGVGAPAAMTDVTTVDSCDVDVMPTLADTMIELTVAAMIEAAFESARTAVRVTPLRFTQIVVSVVPDTVA
jgi:hypothetical protein